MTLYIKNTLLSLQLNDFTSPLNSLESINVPEVREMVGNVTDIISTIGDSFNEEAMNIGIVKTSR